MAEVISQQEEEGSDNSLRPVNEEAVILEQDEDVKEGKPRIKKEENSKHGNIFKACLIINLFG